MKNLTDKQAIEKAKKQFCDEHNLIVLLIEYNGKIYRCVRRSESVNDFGKWDFFYKGNWHEVRSYPIRRKLNNLTNKNREK